MLLWYRALVYVSGHGHTALQFCHFFSARTVRPSNVQVYIASVRRWRLEVGHTDRVHDVWLFRTVLQGIDGSGGSRCSRPRLPISMAGLRLFIDAYRSNTTLDIQDKLLYQAAMLWAFFGFLRCGEFTAILPPHSRMALQRFSNDDERQTPNGGKQV